MRWNIKECRDGYWARKTTGLSAYIRRICLWPAGDKGPHNGDNPLKRHLRRYWPEAEPQGPGYDVNYKGLTIARIYFENKGATVKALDMAGSFPEISDLDLVEIALRIGKLRSAALN